MVNYCLIVESIFDNATKALIKKDKSFIKETINIIKGDKELKTLYKVMEDIKTTTIAEEYVDSYLNDCVDYISKLDFSKHSSLVTEDLAKKYESNSEIVNFGNLFFPPKGANNIDKKYKAREYFKKSIRVRNNRNSELNETRLKVDDLLANLQGETKKLCENFINSNAKGRTALVEDYKSKCLLVINEKIEKETSLETKVKLYETKGKINEMTKVDMKSLLKLKTLHENLS